MKYDGLGRRLEKSVDSKTTHFVFDNLDPIVERNIQNKQFTNLYRSQVFGQSRIVSTQGFPKGSDGQQYWFSYDAIGSAVGITKSDGQSDHNYRYSDFGEIIPENGNFTTPHNTYTYTGQYLDTNYNLYEFHSRMYDPSNSVWLRQDEYRGQYNDPQSLHRYGYVINDPINNWDMYGYADCNGNSIPMTDEGYERWKLTNCPQLKEVQDYYENLSKQYAEKNGGTTPNLSQYIGKDNLGYKLDRAFGGSTNFGGMADNISSTGSTAIEICTAVLFEPADWVFIARDAANGDITPWDLLALAPLVPKSFTSKLDDVTGIFKKSDDILKHADDVGDVGKRSNKVSLTEKITNQLSKRGWTENSVMELIDNSDIIRRSSNKANGHYATVYYHVDGSYVVVDDITEEIIQISDKFDKN